MADRMEKRLVIFLRTPWSNTVSLSLPHEETVEGFCRTASDVLARFGGSTTAPLSFAGLAASQVTEAVKPMLELPIPNLKLTFAGRSLASFPQAASLRQAGLAPYSVVESSVSLLGGGGDGGATGAESRDCYLQMYAGKRPDKVDRRDTMRATWTMCELSGDPLSPPCVADLLGNVFNKEAVVQALVSKSLPPSLSHIKGLKDVFDLHLEPVPGKSDAAVRFHCPISGQEFNGHFKFLALRPCGHVLSVKALRELHSLSLSSHAHAGSHTQPSQAKTILTCPVCHVACDDSPASRVVLHGDEEEVEAARKVMEEEVARRKEGRKKGKNGSNGLQRVLGNGASSTATAAAAAAAKADGIDAGHSEVKKALEEASKKEASPPSARVKGVSESERETGRDGEPSRKRVGVGIHLHQRPDGGKDGVNIVIGKADEGLVAKKRRHDESGRKQQQQQQERPKGSDLVRVEQTWKAGEHVPQGATSAVYKSIFTSSSANQQKETYSCRSLPLARF